MSAGAVGLLQRRFSTNRAPLPDNSDIGDMGPLEGTPLDPNRQAFVRGQQPTQSTQPGTDPAQPNESAQQQTAAAASTNQPETTSSRSVNDTMQSVYDRIMKTTMDDTPSQDRIDSLQGQLDARHKPTGIRSKLATLAAMALPIVGAGMTGNPYAVGGAAGGEEDVLNTMHDRGMQEDQILRQQMEQERGRQERQYERKLQLPITMASMKMMNDWRMSGVDARNHATDQRHLDNNTKLGLDVQGQPLPVEQLPLAVQGRVLRTRAQQILADAQAGVAQAREAMIKSQTDPNGALYKQMQQKYVAQLMTARAAMGRAQAMTSMAATREAQYMEGAFGTDINGNTLPGGYTDDNDQTLGWHAPGNPVATIKNRGQTSAEVLKMFPDVHKALDSVSDDDLGGIAGHVNEWLQGTYGQDNPGLQELRDQLNMVDSAVTNAHFGAGAGEKQMDHFISMLNLGLSKSDLEATLNVFQNWLTNYKEKGVTNVTPGAPNPAAVRPTQGGQSGSPTGPVTKTASSKLSRTTTQPEVWTKLPNGKYGHKKATVN